MLGDGSIAPNDETANCRRQIQNPRYTIKTACAYEHTVSHWETLTCTDQPIDPCTHTHTDTLWAPFVVGLAAHVAITGAICLWHFALFLSSPTGADRFYSSLVPGERDDTHTFPSFSLTHTLA